MPVMWQVVRFSVIENSKYLNVFGGTYTILHGCVGNRAWYDRVEYFSTDVHMTYNIRFQLSAPSLSGDTIV